MLHCVEIIVQFHPSPMVAADFLIFLSCFHAHWMHLPNTKAEAGGLEVHAGKPVVSSVHG